MYALIIVISGILISTRFAFLTAFVITIATVVIGYLQIHLILPTNSYWRADMVTMENIIMICLILFIIAVVSWLSNREIEKSLKRARKSEAELKKERDSLEITVEKRTKELKEVQAEKMAQLYRFAEFGRLSSGLFHDLINPLTAVSLNMEKLKSSNQQVREHIESFEKQTGVVSVAEAAGYIDSAVHAAKKLEDMVIAVRKQLTRQENNILFSLTDEIIYVMDVLSHKAQKAGVKIQFLRKDDIRIFGDAIKFNQVALNLIANAIDAYEGISNKSERHNVLAQLGEENGAIVFSVKDFGIGIPEKNMQKIFEPFFTTKTEGRGIGIGLSMTKRIVEKDFGGSISLKSKIGEETIFTVKFPNRKNEHKS